MQLAHFADAERALERFLPAKIKRLIDTTEHIQHFLEYIGNPQDKVPAIHIAGTSGKSSTAYYAAALLQASGKKTGLLVSPHVLQLNERVQIAGQPLPEAVFCQELGLFLDIVQQSEARLTYAEILYAFGFWEFARQRVEYMVIEVGRGGLTDATNVMSRPDKLCIITDISLDHTKALGPTLAAIARHKAGIIGLHNVVFCYRQAPEIMHEIRTAAQRKQADLHVYATLPVPEAFRALPAFQQRNASLALQAVQWLLDRNREPPLLPGALQQAAAVYIPGRMEIRPYGNKVIILDGAHNPHKLQVLVRSVQQRFPGQAVAVMVAFSRGDGSRRLADMVGALQPISSHLIATAAEGTGGNSAFRAPTEIVAAAAAAGIGSYEAVGDAHNALQALLARPEPVLLITGSLYLPGQLSELHHLFSSSE